MSPARGWALRAGIVLLVASAIGCAAAQRLYVNPQADLTVYRKVAMLPMTNLTADRFASERVGRALMTELIATDRYQLVEPAELWSTLVAVGGEPGADGIIRPEKLKEAAEKLDAQGVIRGAVTEYQLVRGGGGGEVPQVGFDLEMIDVPTGRVVWRTTVNTSGRGRVPIVGGSGMRSMGLVTQSACRQVVAQLKGRAL
jgi:hypothetical protein